MSFFHGSNDGQKGMGLIMLILIGVAPTAYALNRALPESQTRGLRRRRRTRPRKIIAGEGRRLRDHSAIRARRSPTTCTRTRSPKAPIPRSPCWSKQIGDEVKDYGALAKTPYDKVQNVRNDMYLTSEAIRVLGKDKDNELSADEVRQRSTLTRSSSIVSTKFIPTWVKICVAIALGLGTMVGWKRIVVTVGEKIGKTHLTYGQGAAAELVAAATIGAADGLGLPVSTTHVLSSGVAGTMAANGSGCSGRRCATSCWPGC